MARTGRPRAFDRDAAIIDAMHLFWTHGYEGVSLDQLRRTMGGISSASFYAAFGSKEALYREALARYLDTHGKVVTNLRDPDLSPRDRVERTLRTSAEMQTDPAHPSGCMVTLSATICSVAAGSVQSLTAAERADNRAGIHACVADAVSGGELRADTDIHGLSALFEGVLSGISLQARDGVSMEAINAGITQALNAWDANRT